MRAVDLHWSRWCNRSLL